MTDFFQRGDTSMTRFNRYTPAVLFSAALLLLAPKAHAVDGIVLINQSTSTAGLPGCPHSGFPILICQPGSYRLSGNLTISAVNIDAIDITANGVTLDLNGFSITGPVVCPPFFLQGFLQCFPVSNATGINAMIFSAKTLNVTVVNGTVSGMALGVSLLNGTVERVNVSSNSEIGINVLSGIVRHNVATLNNSGFSVGPGTITGNVASNNSSGIEVTCPATVTENTAFQNPQFNLRTFDSYLGGVCTLANNSAQ
jgi:hypothetical protein